MENETKLPVVNRGMPAKIITILDPQTGTIKESQVEYGTGGEIAAAHQAEQLNTRGNWQMESLGLGKYANLREAATTSEFPALLRTGLKQILFNSYNEEPVTYDQWVQTTNSDKPAEDWLEMNRLGTLPKVAEGVPYPDVDPTVDRVVRIQNDKYGQIFGVTEEMIKFDKSNQIRQYPQDLGAAARQTIETQAYNVINTTGNYTRNSTTGDNDVGANTQTLTFGAATLVTAYGVLRSMKDRRTGRYFNIVPDTLVVAPRLEFAAKQLLLAPDLSRAGTQYGTQEVYGTGGVNPFRGMIRNIIVSPYFGTSFQWCLMQAKKAVVYQEVEPLQLLLASPLDMSNEGYLLRDVIRYRVRVWFGVGFLNDRFAFYSDSSTAPTVG